MRPVLLRMTSFAAFREPTTVDFTGADYFVLVGPTGAGKSTVIDAMTFALYGSVPRWDDRRTVSLALAPTAGRGAVGLVFDVGGERYVVARELRRAPSTGNVTVREARLERLIDPTGTGEPGEDTVPVADGAAKVTAAVEELLGLPFEDFCTCVVLPQGEFAEFLHAAPRDRQKTLKRILGLGVYDVIMQRANGEASAQEQRAALAAERLVRYADATVEAETAATQRVAELERLRRDVEETVPRLTAVTAELDGADAEIATATGQRTALAGLRRPDGVAELDDRRRDGEAAVERAAADADRAEGADADARAERSAAPDRAALERVGERRAELRCAEDGRPRLVEDADRAATRSAAATRAVAAAETAEQDARTRRERADAAAVDAAAILSTMEGDRAALAVPTLPDGVDDVGLRRDRAAAELAERTHALTAAEETEEAARAAVGNGPTRAVLEQAARDHRDLGAARDAQAVADGQHAAAERDRDRSATERDGTRHRLDHARAALAEAERTDLAATLRPALIEGHVCPVCAQAVATVPPPLPGGDVSAARSAVAEAESAYGDAQSAHHRADAAAGAARRDAERVASEVARLEAALAGVGDAAVVRAALDALDALDRALAEAGTALRAARRARDDASAQVDAVRRETDALATALRAARAPLAALRPVAAQPSGGAAAPGAPALSDRWGTDASVAPGTSIEAAAGGAIDAAGSPAAAAVPDGPSAAAALAGGTDAVASTDLPPESDDPVAGWHELVTWAGEQLRARDDALPAVRATADSTAAERDAAAAALTASSEATAEARRAQTGAVRAEQEAISALQGADRRADELRTALEGAPSDAEIDAGLARIAELDRRAAGTDAALRAARAALAGARAAAERTGRDVAAAWDELRRSRDPLVALDAPAPDGTDLAAAWTALLAWAAVESGARDERIRQAGAVARRARGTRDDLLAGLRERLAAHEVAAQEDPVRQAPSAVATALAEARGAANRIAERRTEVAELTAEHDTAREQQQVAKMLGDELRSNRFPRWLVASALDALVADASVVLAELSGGQFALTHEDGEFVVVDHADADARRPVKTLSGGETFQASLALALALSDQLSGLAADGAPRLESIFLDEGFGTLDEANLETVASTLENLATRGDRMVGVITHVPALAERIPVRFTVGRTQRTSTIERAGSGVE